MSGLRMNHRDLDKHNQHLTTQNNQIEHHLDMLNERHLTHNIKKTWSKQTCNLPHVLYLKCLIHL